MDKTKKIRITLVSIGIFVIALGFLLNIYSITKIVKYPNISLPELFYPYRLEGSILAFIGPTMFWIGVRYEGYQEAQAKGKKELLKKIFWDFN